MKTIGIILKDARMTLKLSYMDLEEETKIKANFIRALESGNWRKLPEYPVVVGFVKSLAGVLGVNREQAVALLRRDYPPQSKPKGMAPKPDLKEKFTWSPKLTFFAGIALVFILMLSYLILQYNNYRKPPYLQVNFPQEGQLVETVHLTVSGKTDPEATVVVNNQPALISEDGTFTTEIEVFGGTREVAITAKSRSGKETQVVRKIELSLKETDS